MPSRSLLTLAAAALVLVGCNKPAPTPEAAVPDTGAVDTVAAAGAPIGDSVATVLDSAATNDDSVNVLPADSVADTAMADTTLNN
jgi:hypothetical protein